MTKIDLKKQDNKKMKQKTRNLEIYNNLTSANILQ